MEAKSFRCVLFLVGLLTYMVLRQVLVAPSTEGSAPALVSQPSKISVGQSIFAD